MGNALIALLIATRNRPALLGGRALASVAHQQVMPDLVIIADDSDAAFAEENRRIAEDFARAQGLPVHYIGNTRNKGASGAWNSGAMLLLREASDADGAYLSILDDDDELHPHHIAQIRDTLRTLPEADLIAAAFERVEGKERTTITPPPVLNYRDFLVGNPGIQGGTITLRLSAFLRAGMFDEFLPSCTDRDLCLRLSLLPALVYKPLAKPSVVHYADADRERLSNRNAPARHAGLTAFISKYRHWMRDGEYDACARRAKELFNWRDVQQKPRTGTALSAPAPAPHRSGDAAAVLIVGVIVGNAQQAEGLMADLLELQKDERLAAMDVVVLPAKHGDTQIARWAGKWRKAGMRLFVIGDARRDLFSPPVKNGQWYPISVNRTVLQYHVGRLARRIPGTICWILDEDSRLSALTADESGALARTAPDYIGEMLRLKASGADVAIGRVTGSAPLPRTATVRCQLVDVLHGIAAAKNGGWAHLRRAVPLAELTNVNYYHDYHAHRFLEFPAGLPVLQKARPPQNFLSALPAMVGGILRGDYVSRPLLVAGGGEAIQRGGNTLVFNTSALVSVPNGFYATDGAAMRRSDALWSVLNEKVHGHKIVTGDFPVYQDRSGEGLGNGDIARMVHDIAGYSFVPALAAWDANACTLQAYIAGDDFAGKVAEQMHKRLDMVEAAHLRAHGIFDSMQTLLADEPELREEIAALRKRFFQPDIRRLRKEVEALVRRVLAKETLRAFSASLAGLADIRTHDAEWKKWWMDERVENAKALLQAKGLTRLRLLGSGDEGAVFCSRNTVWKVLFHWHSAHSAADAAFLPSLEQTWTETGGALPPLLSAERAGAELVVSYVYEKSAPYKGGMGAQWVALLAEMREKGLTFWNLDRDNVRVAGGRLILVDYGKDIKPWRMSDFNLMVKKAHLCCFWHFRSDLNNLLTRSLSDDSLPELAGWQHMRTAVLRRSKRTARPPDTAAELLRQFKPRRVLDYGFGKSRDILSFGCAKGDAAVFDIHLDTKAAAHLRKQGVRVYGSEVELLNSGRYDAILSRHVLCEIQDDFRRYLANLRRLVTDDGMVAISACDPNGIAVHTATAHCTLPKKADGEETFRYKKRILSTGNERQHIHRPESLLRREIARANFRVVKRVVTPDIDTQRFEHCGGTLVYLLKPMPPRPPVSLIIRACAMDAPTLAVQVRHLMRQLNHPRGFAEVILALDDREREFVREHFHGDFAKLREEAMALKEQGWVDHIVHPPNDGGKLCRLNKRWFNISTPATHAGEGAPVAAVLEAFDTAKGDYAMHVDIDMVIGRLDAEHDYLSAMLEVMERDNAATMSLCIPGAARLSCQRREEPFRTEVRAGLTNLRMLRDIRPLPNHMEGNDIALYWHRSFDQAIRQRKLASVRYGDQRLYALHIPNKMKGDREKVFAVMDAAERGECPAGQMDKTEWDGDDTPWLPPARREKFVVVICGRNVSRGRMERCLESLARQKNREWGAVVMDDASSPHAADYLCRRLDGDPRFTLVLRRERMGGLRNLHYAVSRLCGDPQSVIVTLDLDDALIGTDVFAVLDAAYAKGADMTVGTMLRTDKQKAYPVNFADPRGSRGGNVWQHLRSFRKRLFDAIPPEHLMLDGEFIDLAADWAYMLPITEMARQPVHIRAPLYLYDPQGKASAAVTAQREQIIARIMEKTPCKKK